jgi:hypothetical protein
MVLCIPYSIFHIPYSIGLHPMLRYIALSGLLDSTRINFFVLKYRKALKGRCISASGEAL